jgi:hypothetical protein
MRPRRRYLLRLEEYDENGRLERVLEESRFQLDSDHSDGEATWGYLLSFVPQWAAALTGCSGIACVAGMLSSLVGEGLGRFRELGAAYERWDAEENFDDCVLVVINEDKLNGTRDGAGDE